MARRTRIYRPPATGSPQLDTYLQDISDILNLLPNFSIISTTDGPESTTTGERSDIALDIGSAVTTLWVKTSGTTTIGWSDVI